MEKIYNLLEKYRKLFFIMGDSVLIILAMLISFVFSKQKYTEDLILNFFMYKSTYLGILTLIILFNLFELYRYKWRYAGTKAVRSLIMSCIVGTIAYAFYETYFDNLGLLKYQLVLFCILIIMFTGTLRLIARSISKLCYSVTEDLPVLPKKNLVIIGANEESARLIKAIKEDVNLRHYNIAGIVDYKKNNIGTYIDNIKVIGHINNLQKIINSHNIAEVLFTLPENYAGSEIRSYVLECRQKRIPVKVVSSISDRLSSRNRITLKDINVEDLLHRPSKKIDLNLYSDYINNRVVLVTGAGGSIGSEIVRLVASLEPKQLILLGHGENSIFSIDQEIRINYPELNIYPVIASITDKERIHYIFNNFKPEVVFHAAAHKHVPLMEQNIQEAVKNNVIGTKNIVEAALLNKVTTMVQISTDKAADPSSVMGATKFVCEQIVKSVAQRNDCATKFVIVRFGNVLGSRGSVIPSFLKQIEQGGPVSVTHKDMTRYFMIIPEACRLVIQSGSIGENGNIYVLDMGQPVRIMDLAEDIISICGYIPNKDMEISITGIRPGEKLHEVLSSATEGLKTTDYSGIDMIASAEVVDYNYLSDFVDTLNTIEKTKDAKTFIHEVSLLRK